MNELILLCTAQLVFLSPLLLLLVFNAKQEGGGVYVFEMIYDLMWFGLLLVFMDRAVHKFATVSYAYTQDRMPKTEVRYFVLKACAKAGEKAGEKAAEKAGEKADESAKECAKECVQETVAAAVEEAVGELVEDWQSSSESTGTETTAEAAEGN